MRVVLPVTALALAAGAVVGFAHHGAGAPAPAAASAASDDVGAGEAAALLADVQDSSGAPAAGPRPVDGGPDEPRRGGLALEPHLEDLEGLRGHVVR